MIPAVSYNLKFLQLCDHMVPTQLVLEAHSCTCIKKRHCYLAIFYSYVYVATISWFGAWFAHVIDRV